MIPLSIAILKLLILWGYVWYVGKQLSFSDTHYTKSPRSFDILCYLLAVIMGATALLDAALYKFNLTILYPILASALYVPAGIFDMYKGKDRWKHLVIAGLAITFTLLDVGYGAAIVSIIVGVIAALLLNRDYRVYHFEIAAPSTAVVIDIINEIKNFNNNNLIFYEQVIQKAKAIEWQSIW